MMFFAPYTLSFGRDLPHSSSSGNDYVLVSKELRGTDRRKREKEREKSLYYDYKLTYFNRYCEIRHCIFDRYVCITIGHVTAFLEIISYISNNILRRGKIFFFNGRTDSMNDETKNDRKEERRCAFFDVRAHTARTADRNVTLSQEVADKSKDPESACPSFNECRRYVCVSGRKVFSLSAKNRATHTYFLSFVYTFISRCIFEEEMKLSRIQLI